MSYSSHIPIIGDWFRLHFVENNGFAFGTELKFKYGKLILSLFRLVAVLGISYYVFTLIRNKGKHKTRLGYVIMVALVLAGAIGNIIDSTFYGLIFSHAGFHSMGTATLFPPDGGYAGLFHGQVVDMFHVSLYEGYFPEWVPYKGGDYFEFFRPVFNIADVSISVGVAGILLFFRGELKSFK